MDAITKTNKLDTILEKKEKPVKKTNAFTAFIQDIVKNKWLSLMTLPGIIFLLIFSYLPLCGLAIAFQDFKAVKGIFGSKFVGFKNFEFFLGSKDIWQATFNTIYLNLLFIIGGMIVSIAIAVMLSEIKNKSFVKISQSVVILPHFMSWSIIAMFAVAIFSTDEGMLNDILVLLGMERISFYQTPEVWRPILLGLNLWHGAGFGSIVYLAAITGIDSEIYEAAKIDGATRWMCIFKITLPLLKNTAILLFIMAIGKIFYGNFSMIYALVGGNSTLWPTTDVIDTYTYRQLMDLGDMGMASAVGFYQSIIGFVIVLLSNALAKKFSPESAVF